VYAYTVLESARQGQVVYECAHAGCPTEGPEHTLSAESWIGGERVSPGDRVLLPKGKVPLMVRVQVDQWGSQPARLLLHPRVVAVKPEGAMPSRSLELSVPTASGRVVLP
jgi:hypothetical protein